MKLERSELPPYDTKGKVTPTTGRTPIFIPTLTKNWTKIITKTIPENMTKGALDRNTNDIGFNPVTGVFENFYKTGIIDPVKVTKAAIKNAASVAGILLITQALVADIPEKKESYGHGGGGMGMPGMGGMGMGEDY